MSLPKVTCNPGAVDLATLRQIGALPLDPAFDSLQSAVEARDSVERIQTAVERAHALATNLAERAQGATSNDELQSIISDGFAQVFEPLQRQIEEMAGDTAPSFPPNDLGIDVDERVAQFKRQVEAATSLLSEAANGPPDTMEQAFEAASAQMKMSLLDAAGQCMQTETGFNPVTFARGAEALSQDHISASGGLSALAAMAGSLPGGAEAAQALGLAAQAVQIGEKVDFTTLLSGGSPDLAAVADALDAMQSFAMGELMGVLPPQAQQLISVAQTIMAAYGIDMPTLSELAGLKESGPSSPKTPGCYVEGQFVATILNPTSHGSPTLPGIGAPIVLYNFLPIWRAFLDFHLCPVVKGLVPDVGGVVMKAATKTIVLGSFAARKGDEIIEIPGGPNKIIPGPTSSGEDQEDQSTSSDQPEKESNDPDSDSGERSRRPDSSSDPEGSDAEEGMDDQDLQCRDDGSSGSDGDDGGPEAGEGGEKKNKWGKVSVDPERRTDYDGTAKDFNDKTSVAIGGSYKWAEGGDQWLGDEKNKVGYYDYEASSGYSYDPKKNQSSFDLLEAKGGFGVQKAEGELPLVSGQNFDASLTGGDTVMGAEASAKIGAGWGDEFKGAEASAGASADLVKLEGGAKVGVKIPFTDHKITFGVSSSASVGVGAKAEAKAGYSADEGFEMKAGAKVAAGLGFGLGFSIGFK